MTDSRFPYRVVDTFNQGWHPTGGKDEEPVYETFTGLHGERMPGRTWNELMATRAPLRPVENVTDEDVATLRALFAEAGRKTITTLATALESVHHQVRELHGGLDEAHASYGWAQRTLVAGRPGSWESAALLDVIMFGNELNLAKPGKGQHAYDVDARRKAGPSKRVDAGARQAMAAILWRWVTDPDRYTEVAETLASVVSGYCDDTAGPDGWRQVADQWLQPDSLARESFSTCYRLFYSVSEHLNTGLF